MKTSGTKTVLVDTREQRPLLFPGTVRLRGRLYKILVDRVRLDAGDYQLRQGCKRRCIVERKSGLWEIYTNYLTPDRKRYKRAMDKLCAATDRPVLLVESSIPQLLTPQTAATNRPAIPDPGLVLQHLVDDCSVRGISLVFGGYAQFASKRRKLGELVLRILLAKTP